jgi:p-aminobenzoyl-glutamate transporter AbgT
LVADKAVLDDFVDVSVNSRWFFHAFSLMVVVWCCVVIITYFIKKNYVNSNSNKIAPKPCCSSMEQESKSLRHCECSHPVIARSEATKQSRKT